MMLDKVVYICFMFFKHIEASRSEERSFYVSETTSTWTEMERICSVGEPSFGFLSGSYVVSNVDIPVIKNTGDGVWVGYFEVMEYFYNIGCLTEDQVQHVGVTIANYFKGSPGYCYRQCGYGVFFGLMESKCVCFQEEPTFLNVSSKHCNRSCNYQQGVACGGLDSLSVYKFYSMESESNIEQDTKSNNNMFCLRLNLRDLHYSWTNCTEEHVIVCDFGKGKYIPTSNPGTSKSWIDSAQICFADQAALLLPVDNNISLSVNKNFEVWTKLIKSPVIYPFHSYDKAFAIIALFKARVIRYGFLARQEHRYILKFTEDTTDKTVLCAHKFEAFSWLETVVGISVAAGALLAAFVFSILILKIRRQKKKSKTNTSESHDNCTDVPPASPTENLPSGPYHSMNPDMKTHHDYEIIADEISEQLPNHNYYILEKINKTENVGEISCSLFTLDSSHNGANKQLKKENTTKEKVATTSTGPDICIGKGTEVSVYDKCYVDNRNAYDHVCISGNNVAWKADKTYNTTI